MATPPVRIEARPKEAWIAVIFVILIIGILAGVSTGIIANPLTVGLIITLSTLLILFGHFLATRGILSRDVLPIWYMLVLGIMMIIAGGIVSGAIAPAFVFSGASILEIAITNALFYTIAIVAVLTLVIALILYRKKPRIPRFF